MAAELPPIDVSAKFWSIVVIELFGGILMSSEAAKELCMPVVRTYFSEVDEDVCLVALTNFREAVPCVTSCHC